MADRVQEDNMVQRGGEKRFPKNAFPLDGEDTLYIENTSGPIFWGMLGGKRVSREAFLCVKQPQTMQKEPC